MEKKKIFSKERNCLSFSIAVLSYLFSAQLGFGIDMNVIEIKVPAPLS